MLLLEQILYGLLVGNYYTLLALGLSIIFSLGGVVNLAHWAFYAVGAYLIVFLSELIGFPVAFVVTPILVGMIGIIVETFFLRRLYTKDPILTLLFTFGLAMSAEQVELQSRARGQSQGQVHVDKTLKDSCDGANGKASRLG